MEAAGHAGRGISTVSIEEFERQLDSVFCVHGLLRGHSMQELSGMDFDLGELPNVISDPEFEARMLLADVNRRPNIRIGNAPPQP